MAILAALAQRRHRTYLLSSSGRFDVTHWNASSSAALATTPLPPVSCTIDTLAARHAQFQRNGFPDRSHFGLHPLVCSIPTELPAQLGKTVDFLLTAKRDIAAAKRFFNNAIESNGDPDKVAMDKSGANKPAIDTINAGRYVPILVRQINIVDLDHRAIKRVTKPMLNFKSFHSAASVIAGIELMP